MNMLAKVVVPRIKESIKYILEGLEELQREDLYRLKKVLEVKKRKLMEKEQLKKKTEPKKPGDVCRICTQDIGGKLKEPSKIYEPKPIPSVKQVVPPKEKVASAEKVFPTVQKPQKEEPMKFVRSKRALDPLSILTRGESNEESKLQYLMRQLGEIIALGSSFAGKRMENIDIDELLTACEEAKAKLETSLQNVEVEEQPDEHLQCKLEHLKSHLKEVTNVMNEFREEVVLSPSIDNFICTCEEVQDKLHLYINNGKSQQDTDAARHRLIELKGQINDLVKVTKQYQKEELLSPSVDEFLKSCEIVKSKIDSRTEGSPNEEKLKHLKHHVEELESLTTKVKSEGLLSASLEDFLKSCKDFKSKLVFHKNKDKKPPDDEGLDRLVSHLDETIDLSKKAKSSGLVSASVEDFIKSCEHIKWNIESKQKLKTETAETPNVLDDLEVNIDDIMQLISQFRKDGLISESMEKFVKSCETTKAKVEVYKRYPEDDSEGTMLLPICGSSCICSPDNVSEDLCDRCDEMLKEKKSPTDLAVPPCGTCSGIVPEDSEDQVCGTCNKPPELEEPLPSYVSPEPSEMCDVCRRYMEESEKEKEEEEEAKPVSPVDSTLGYFEKKVRKITRVTRTLNDDGTVREEKEIIIIRKEKHDPNETTIDDDDEDFGDMSFESLIEDEEKNVGLCLLRHPNNQGFIIKSQSDNFTRRFLMAEPSLRSCVSADAVGSMSFRDIMARISFLNYLSQSQSSSANTLEP